MSEYPTLYVDHVEKSCEIHMVTIAPSIQATTAFPKNDVIKALVDDLLEVARIEAQLRGIALPTDEAGIRNAPVPLDSLSIVDTLCVVEAVIGFELRDNIVQTGGYLSVEEALWHLVPRIEKVWIKKKGAKP